jgi:hypothetical protein
LEFLKSEIDPRADLGELSFPERDDLSSRHGMKRPSQV